MVMPTAVAGVDQGPKGVKRVKTRDQHTGQLCVKRPSKTQQGLPSITGDFFAIFCEFVEHCNDICYKAIFPKINLEKLGSKIIPIVHFEIRESRD